MAARAERAGHTLDPDVVKVAIRRRSLRAASSTPIALATSTSRTTALSGQRINSRCRSSTSSELGQVRTSRSFLASCAPTTLRGGWSPPSHREPCAGQSTSLHRFQSRIRSSASTRCGRRAFGCTRRASAGRVVPAYSSQCAICRLKELRLLDAAHIVSDLDEGGGEPTVQNGLSLCAIHHRAFDQVSGRSLARLHRPCLDAATRGRGRPDARSPKRIPRDASADPKTGRRSAGSGAAQDALHAIPPARDLTH